MTVPFSAKVTLWLNRLIMLVLVALAFAMPALLRWYETVRVLGSHVAQAISLAFYCCCPPVAAALGDLDRILRNILSGKVFVPQNVSCIRRIRWYCLATGLICLPASFRYPPLIFVFIIMGFLSLVVTVLASVMHAAVALREENDLTI
jgi:hypothetical protein